MQDFSDTRGHLRSDRGEVSSWLVLMAGLVVAAAAVAVPLRDTMTGLARAIGGEAAVVAGEGPGDTGPGDTGPGNTGPGNTGPGNTGPGDTGPGNTGPTALNEEQRLQVQRLINQGYTADIARAIVTGDWTDVEGGDPTDYSEDELAIIARALGFDESEDLGEVQALLDELDPGLLSLLLHEGRSYELSITAGGISTPGGLLLPASLSATLEAGVAVSLSDPAIGVGFGQTQDLEITATVLGRLEGSAGKNTLAKVYKRINQLGFVPDELKALVAKNPLLQGALNGLPFSVAYSEYVGFQLGYEATLNPGQVAALQADDLSALPNIFDPSTFEPGNSALIRAGKIEGSDFMLKYKALQLDANDESFDGTGFGVTALDDGSIAIFAGDIDAFSQSLGLGIPIAQIVASHELTGLDYDYAVLDLNTPEGQAAYDEFITGGGVPQTDAPGVTTAQADVIAYDYELGLQLNLGFAEVGETFTTQGSTLETLTYEDGSQVTTFNANYNGDHASQLVLPHNDDGTVNYDEAEVTVVFGGLDENRTSYITAGYSDETFAGDHDVQVTYTASDLHELQGLAQQTLQNYNSPAQYESLLASPVGFVSALAAAETTEDIAHILIGNSPSALMDPVEGLGTIALGAPGRDSGEFAADLPGSIETRPAG